MIKCYQFSTFNNPVFKLSKLITELGQTGHKMAKSSIKRSDKKEGKKGGMNSMNPDRDTSALKGVAKPRSAGTIKRLQMYKNFKAKRDKRGAVIKAAPYQGYVDSGTRARVEPARGWFSNTKVITQSALQKFQVTS